jgi:hypothetical protein
LLEPTRSRQENQVQDKWFQCSRLPRLVALAPAIVTATMSTGMSSNAGPSPAVGFAIAVLVAEGKFLSPAKSKRLPIETDLIFLAGMPRPSTE